MRQTSWPALSGLGRLLRKARKAASDFRTLPYVGTVASLPSCWAGEGGCWCEIKGDVLLDSIEAGARERVLVIYSPEEMSQNHGLL